MENIGNSIQKKKIIASRYKQNCIEIQWQSLQRNLYIYWSLKSTNKQANDKLPIKIRLCAMMLVFQKRHYSTSPSNRENVSVVTYWEAQRKKSPEVRAVTLQYSQHCCSPQIAFPRWLTPEQMLLVKVLAAMHQVQTLFFFHLNWFVSSQIAYPRKLISRLGGINHGVTLFQTRVLFAVRMVF